MTQTVPPTPQDAETISRWEETRKRRRMLYGEWRAILQSRVREAVGTKRADAWAGVDLSSNVFLQVCSQLAVLYDHRVTVNNPDDEAAAAMVRGVLTGAGYEPVMQVTQRDTLGLREMLVRVDAELDERSSIGFRAVLRRVYPDMVEAYAWADDPGQPYKVCEYRWRKVQGQEQWVREVVEVRDGVGLRWAETMDGRDVTEELGMDGPFPWLDESGRPVMPYVVYHAAWPSHLWDPCAGEELVEGTLQAAVAWTMAHHALMQASWPQRYAVGMAIAADMPNDNDAAPPRHEVVADPATVLMFQTDEESTNATIGQWNPGADPEAMFRAVAEYEQRVATASGVSASDFVRTSGDPRSGYALALSRAGKREASARYEPIFAASDALLYGVVAAALNGAGIIPSLPVTGYTPEYAVLPLSPDEERERRETVFAMLDRGLITRERAAEMLGEGMPPEPDNNQPAPPAEGETDE